MTEAREPSYDLSTQRLRLHALSLDEARLALVGDLGALGRALGAAIPPGWPGKDLTDALSDIVPQMQRQASDERWLWVAIEPGSANVIGDIGFHGPVTGSPTVELGYLILPDYQGRGYATEAAEAMIAWAAERPGVDRVIVRIAHHNVRSLRVAAKLGMRETVSHEPIYRRFERVVHRSQLHP
ncbi:MAG TPA: GNAT family N-acetyltransferase [Ktedonobacterales bacterium]|nr:GNAT family N-acetyltransferase [Ktedonobacterales bacterium]